MMEITGVIAALGKPRIQAAVIGGTLIVLTGIVAVVGEQSTPKPTTVPIHAQVGRVCPAFQETPGKLLVTAGGSGDIVVTPMGGAAANKPAKPFVVDEVHDAHTLVATENTVVFAAGTHITGSKQQQWATCLPTSVQQRLIFDNDDSAVVQLINPHGAQALVNLSLTGPDGEVVAEDLRDLRVEPRAVLTIPIGAKTKVTPLAVSVQSSTGRVLAVGANRSVHGADIISPTAMTRGAVLPAVPTKARSVNLLISNPATIRTNARIEVLGPNGRFVPEGGQQLVIEAGRTKRFDLTSTLRGEAAAIVVVSDTPVISSLVARTEHDLAYSTAQALPLGTNAKVIAAPVAGGGELVLSNPGDRVVKATIGWGEGKEVVHKDVPAGTSITIPAPEGAHLVKVEAETPLTGGFVVGNTADRGVAITPLTEYTDFTATIPVRVEPRLGR